MIADSGREAAWQRYRESIPIRRVIQKPESGDVRLAFEAGYNAALRDLETFAALARDWRAKSQEIRESEDAGPVMLAIRGRAARPGRRHRARDPESARVAVRRRPSSLWNTI